MTCKRCGAKNSDNAVYCMNCGVKIGSNVRIFNENSTVNTIIRTKSPALLIFGTIFAVILPFLGIILGAVGRFYYSTRLQRNKSLYNIIVGCACHFARLLLGLLLVILFVLIILAVILLVTLI